MDITQEDVRAARAMLQWSQDQLAKAAGVGISTIADFEKGVRTPIPNNLNSIRSALEGAGVVFTPVGPTIFGEAQLYYMAENDGMAMHFRYRLDQAPVMQEIVGTFGTVVGNAVELLIDQKVTPALRGAVDQLIAQHGAVMPQLNKLKQKIGKLKDDSYFLLLPGVPASTKDQLDLERRLHTLNNPGEQVGVDDADGLFGPLLERYEVKNPRTDRLTVIGKDLQPRTCRFCGRTASDKADKATFKKVAHVIPTALGNDHLKSAEECDDCNEHFGDHTEPSLISMLDIQRVFLGTEGRGGRPKLKFGHDTIMHDGTNVVLQAHSISRDADDTFEVNLGRGAPLVPVAVYRALVKIVLSVIDATQLPHLKKTIEWVRYGNHAGQPLPLVAASIVNLPPDPSAQITVYTRKEAHSRLPHVVGEFRLGCYIFVFAVPFSTQDEWDLVGFFDDQDFRDTFQHYAQGAKWSQRDLSGTTEIVPTPKLRFAPK